MGCDDRQRALTFSADSALVARVVPSPNQGPRRSGRRPDLLLLHYTQMTSADAALARLCDPASEVSAHYLVDEAGAVIQMVPERERAWHAGRGAWAGDPDINSCSIGIEIANGGHEAGLPAYPDAQVAAVAALGRDIVGRWSIAPERVLAHSDIAPDRKEDPGEHFPWSVLHAAGVGQWVPPAPLAPGPSLVPGSRSPEVGALQADLRGYGYPVEVTGLYDDATASVVTAFQRHFRPERVDGIADPSTLATLAALIAQRGAAAAPAKMPAPE